MAKIYCLVGKSCSGKDTMFQRILDKRPDVTPIITYTTRPKRSEEKNAKEYYFVDKNTFNKLKHNNKIIEYRKYKTVYGDWYYFTANDNQIDIKSNNRYLMINTVNGARKLKDVYGDNNVVVIHITVEDDTRLLRAFAREMNGNKNFVEMCRRFVSDSKDYSIENFIELNLNPVEVSNNNILECTNQILDVIK